MKKLIIIIVIAIAMVTGILVNTKSTPQMAETVKDETLRGDIVELQGKSMFYKDKYGEYPVFMDDIYDMADSDVVWATQVFENFFSNSKGAEAEQYIRDNVKLIDIAEMKSKGITYELANKKSKYYLDLITGKVLNPELIERGDEDYIDDLNNNDGLYGPLATKPIKIEDTETGEKMTVVNGSLEAGSSVYFYGKGDMKLAIRNERTNEIKNVGQDLDSDIIEILYIQKATGKAAIVVKKEDGSEKVEIRIIKIGR